MNRPWFGAIPARPWGALRRRVNVRAATVAVGAVLDAWLDRGEHVGELRECVDGLPGCVLRDLRGAVLDCLHQVLRRPRLKLVVRLLKGVLRRARCRR